ncbi:MAG: ABC transporter ATP-binding protein [Bacteroidales bacterium]|nr:ABC transporter ATP-binding protein [Bacteroidales bacterium]
MENEYAIILQNVSKKYRLYKNKKDRMKEALHPLGKKLHKDFYAINDLSLDIKKGEILGIVGKNGSGKSTLLKLIAGVIEPTDGRIITKGDIVPLLELGSGFNPEYTGLENIYFYCSIMGLSRKETDLKLKEITDFADIGDFIYQPIKTYSSGMKARLAFAVSVNIDPDILILDEVLAVGDELFRRKSYAKMEEFFKAGKTILYVSHSANTVNELCSKAILLDTGEIILRGEPKQVTAFYHKLIFAKKENKDKVLNEIKLLNKGEKILADDIQTNDDTSNKINTLLDKDIDDQSYYIHDFKPKSSIRYDNFDVNISDYFIKTTDGRKVNALVQNRDYVYGFNVSFGIDAEKVRFGTSFKTEKGQIISGAAYPYDDSYIEKINKGQKFNIEIKFKCTLLPANYYLTTGIKGLINEDIVFLNRIEDILVFKVIKNTVDQYWGVVNLNQRLTVTDIT